MTYKRRQITNSQQCFVKVLLHIIFNTPYPCQNSKQPYKQETIVYNFLFIYLFIAS